MKFAENTNVSSEQSRAEIERTLNRYGATGFMYGWNADTATIMFEMQARRVMFRLQMPDRSAREFVLTPGGKRERSPQDALKAWEQACRQRWRALALVIKAKLEAVETGITVFEDEFMAHIVLPGNRQTVSEWLRPQLAHAYETGKMPPLLGYDGCDGKAKA